MKKILSIFLILGLALSPITALESTATVLIKTNVGETLDNAGLRLIEGTGPISPSDFDSTFLAAGSALTLDNTALNNAATEVSGSFTVLVKRATAGKLTVGIKAFPLAGLAENLPYNLEFSEPFVGGGTRFNILNSSIEKKFKTNAGFNGVVRHTNLVNYTIPVNNNVAHGIYEGDIVFTLTLP